MHTHTHTNLHTEQEQHFTLEERWQEGKEQGFTAPTKIKHEDFVVPQCSWKDKYYFLYEREKSGDGLRGVP